MNVNDIWSLPDPPQIQNEATVLPAPMKVLKSGSFGKPGIVGGGEGGGFQGSMQEQEQEPAREDGYRQERPRVDEKVSDEKERSPEVGEKLKPAEARKRKEEKIKESQVVQPEEAPAKGKTVDQRTGKVRMHRVAEIADKTTKVADIKEQGFIEGVEIVHSIV